MHLIGWKWNDLLPHIEDSIRNGDFDVPNEMYLEIIIEKRLYSHSIASIDEAGNLLIVADADVPEDQQQFVYLPPQATRALRNLLNSPEASNLIRQP